MDDKERFLRDLLSEAKEIRKRLEDISIRLKELDRIEDELKDFKRTYERKSGR